MLAMEQVWAVTIIESSVLTVSVTVVGCQPKQRHVHLLSLHPKMNYNTWCNRYGSGKGSQSIGWVLPKLAHMINEEV